MTDLKDMPQRVGVLSEIPALLTELGLDPAQVLADCDLPPDALADMDGSIPFLSAIRLLEISSQRTNRKDFGLLLGLRGSTSQLGLTGLLMQNAPTLDQAIRDIIGHHPRYVRGGTPYIIDREEDVIIGYRSYIGGPKSWLIGMAVVGFGYRVFTDVSRTIPTEITFACRPLDQSAIANFPGSRVTFEARQFALRYRRKDLATPIQGASDATRRAVLGMVEQYDKYLKPDLIDSAKRAIVMLLFRGDLDVDRLAHELRVNRRTLGRHLAAAGTTPWQLINQVRFEIALQLITATRLSLSDVSETLGFAELSSFTRWFRAEAGKSPSAYRSVS